MIKINNIELKGQVVSAPMAGITNKVYRNIAKEFGAALTYTEMISDKALVFGSKATYEMIDTKGEKSPVSLQLFGGDLTYLLEAVKIINKKSTADILDINMGCPVPKVLRAKAGSYWLKDPLDAYKKVKAIVEISEKPVSVKLRLGIDKENINVVEVAKLMEKAGVKLICVHARVQKQRYGGKADYSYIKKVKEAVTIPVIGNGDINSVEDAIRMLEETNCDAIMIGRGALGNPWLFKEIDHYLKTKQRLKPPTLKEKIDFCLRHAKELCSFKNETIAIKEMRSHVSWYLKGQNNAKHVKILVNKVNTYFELEKLLKDFLKEELK